MKKALFLLFLIVASAALDVNENIEHRLAYEEFSKIGRVAMSSVNHDDFIKLKTDKSLRKNVDYVLIVYLAVKAVCLLYRGIVAIFGHSISRTYEDIQIEKGYDALKSKLVLTYVEGVNPGKDCKNLDKSLKTLATRIVGIKYNTQAELERDKDYIKLKRAFTFAKYMDFKVWGKKNFMLGGKDSLVNYISVMIQKNLVDGYKEPEKDDGTKAPLCDPEHEEYLFLFIYCKAAFKINPAAIRIISTDERWGIFRNKQTFDFDEVPRGVEIEDVEQIFKFFTLKSLQLITQEFKFNDLNAMLPKMQVQ